MNIPFIIVFTIVVIGLWMLPAYVACFRRHHNATAITILAFLTGWSGLGWIVAMVWAFTSTETK